MNKYMSNSVSKHPNTMTGFYHQSGAALLVALSFLVVITLISLGAIRSSTTELRLASNHEERVAAIQVAQSAIDSAINDTGNFVVSGTEGTVNSNVTISGVTEFNSTDLSITEQVTGLPSRVLGVSADKFQSTTFDIASAYNNTTGGRGQAAINQGMILLVPKT